MNIRANGVVVSNHGGRQLDESISTIMALGPTADAVNDRVVVLMDGGIRRGHDIAKALAMGAIGLSDRSRLRLWACGDRSDRHAAECRVPAEGAVDDNGNAGLYWVDALDRRLLHDNAWRFDREDDRTRRPGSRPSLDTRDPAHAFTD